jgi:uncharacterized protein
MPGTFVDTSGWGHLVDPTQVFHSQAATLYRQARQQGSRLVTTNYILTELVALLTSPVRIPRTRVIEFISGLKTSPYLDIIHVDAQLDSQAWLMLVDRPDKEWSLVDCASFVVMRQVGITEALTTDRHFEQAGFVRLLKP